MERSGPTRVLATAGFWAAVLGAVGFACGFFGPIVFSPDANQGPLLGIFITGPGGAALGAILGFVVGLLPLSARVVRLCLIVVSIALAGVTLYFCMPSPEYRASIVDAEILACDPPASRKDKAIEYWEDRIAKVTWAPPRAGWREDLDRMLREDQGVVLHVKVIRKSGLYENRKPWNKGSMTVRPWEPEAQEQDYMTRRWGPSCGNYRVGTRDLHLAKGEIAKQWPPEVLSNVLDLQVLEPVPDAYRRLVSE